MLQDEEFYEDFKLGFAKMDADHDGIVTREEFETCFKKLEVGLPVNSVEDIYKKKDPGKKGLTCDELFKYSPSYIKPVMRFFILDGDNDGKIDFEGFKRMGLFPHITEESLKAKFGEIDQNHDGLVTMEEIYSAHP